MITRAGRTVLLALALALPPVAAEGQQFLLRDDVNGWGWLALTPDTRAVVQLIYGSPQSGDQGRLDMRLLNDLRSMGVRRVWDFADFEPTENQVMGECAAVGYSAPDAEQPVYGLHVEVSYWDHTRLAATEIYESVTLGQVAPTDLATDTYVDACVAQLSSVLTRLGYDEG